MSVQANTYVMWGHHIQTADVRELRSAQDRLEPYMDHASARIEHLNGLCCLWDGMCGKYVMLGRVFAKSKVDQGLDEPFSMPPADAAFYAMAHEVTREVSHLLGDRILPTPGWIVLTHYR